MSAVKVAVACGCVALLLSACGVAPKPEAGAAKLTTLAATSHLRTLTGFHGVRDDPRIKHAACLRAAKIHFREYRATKDNLPAIQVGSAPDGPTIIFYPTPGIAQGQQIMGREQGAEVIGSALLYPNHAATKVLSTVETCTAAEVTG